MWPETCYIMGTNHMSMLRQEKQLLADFRGIVEKYFKIIDLMWFLADSLWQHHRVTEDKKRLMHLLSENSGLFPLHIGEDLDANTKIQLVLYLVSTLVSLIYNNFDFTYSC